MADQDPILQKITVMIVDDHPIWRQGLAGILEDEPDIQVVAQTQDGQEALKFARELRPDVMILDINLPGLNGLQITSRLREERNAAAVIILTGYDDEEQVLHAIRAGSSAYCVKDTEPTHLVNVIREVMRGHYVVKGEVHDQHSIDEWVRHRVEAATGPYMVDPNEHFVPLSRREMEILRHVTHGRTNKQIAQTLGISHQTVKNHVSSILTKLDVEDRTQAAIYAMRRGWVRIVDTVEDDSTKE